MIKNIYNLLELKLKRKLWILLLLTFASTAFELLSVGLIIPAISFLVESDIYEKYPQLVPVLNFLGNPSQKYIVSFGMVFLAFIYLLKSSFLTYFVFWQNRFANEFQVRTAERLFTKYIKQPYTFHLQNNSAKLIRNINNEVMSVYSSLQSVLNFFMEIFVVTAFAFFLIYIEPIGSLIILFFGFLIAFGYSKFAKTIVNSWGAKKVWHLGKSTQSLMEGIGGAKDVKLLGRESQFIKKFNYHNKKFANLNRINTSIAMLPRVWLEFVAIIGLTIIVGSIIIQDKDFGLILPTVAVFGIASFRLLPSVTKILNAIQNIKYNEASVDIIFKDLQLEYSEISYEITEKINVKKITIKTLTFHYPSFSENALNNISVELNKGKSLGIIGESGSGKSTLVDIILGLLTPTDGGVFVNGNNVNLSLKSLRLWQNQIGYVPQSIYLSDDTLRNNIAFGLPENKIDDKAVINSIKNAQLEGFIDDLPDKLNSNVGERGVRLSGGQRQRIGIARALYHNPSVIVLDEATSALDNETEAAVMKCIDLLQNKTKIIVAHRLSTVKNCDIIIKLKNGVIVEKGSPKEILPL